MIKKYYGVFGPALRVLDAIILAGTWVVAYYLRKKYPLGIMTNSIPPFKNYVGFTILVILLWGAVFSYFQIYASKRITRRSVEANKVLRAHAVSLLIFIALTYLFATYRLSRGVFLYFGTMSAFLLVAVRLALRNTLRRLRAQGYNLQNILIAGTGQVAIETFKKLRHHPELGLNVVGFLGKGAIGDLIEGVPIVGSYDLTLDLIQKKGAVRLVVALDRAEYQQLDAILRSLKEEIIDIIMVPDLHEYMTLGCEIEDFDGLPMVSLNEPSIHGLNVLMKRLGDIILALLAIAIFGPIMMLLAILIKLSSPGPVLYRQERMSLNGRRFPMYKFRSMAVNQVADVELLTKKNDPRVTTVGQLMRTSSLDEIPQFFNVLLGHMSIVGPRPERTWVVDELRNKIPSYMLKHKVKAGITGWAQVNGWRGDTSLEKRIEYDLYYIRNWSLLFDLKILWLTVFKGFINRNAY